MTACEACWSKAYFLSRLRGGHQAEIYRDLVTKNHVCPSMPPVPRFEETSVT